MRGISRKFFNEHISDSKVVKALELYLFVKVRYEAFSSTIKDFRYNSLSKETGLCFTTIKKRINILKQLGLVEFIGKDRQHLLFKSLKSKKSNVRIEQIDFSTIKTIGDGLRALFLVEVQVQKEYIRQLMMKYNNPSKSDDYKAIRREVRKRGLMGKKFEDNGISYKYMANKLKIGYNKVHELIKCATERGMVAKKRNAKLIYDANVSGANVYSVFEFEEDKRHKYISNNCIYYLGANTYVLWNDLVWYGI